MGDNTILSQDEINTLLNSDSKIVANPLSGKKKRGEVHAYDPYAQHHLANELYQTLEIIGERFARQFCVGLLSLLHRSPYIHSQEIRIQSYHDFARDLPTPSSLNLIRMEPLHGTALVVFSPELIFILLDNLFGGDGLHPIEVKDRKSFTAVEQRIIKLMLRLALEAYGSAWKSFKSLKVEYVRSETQARFTNITTSPNDPVVNTPFRIEIGNQVGEINICLPLSMIEPLRGMLLLSDTVDDQENQEWRNNLLRQMQNSRLELVANFAEIPLRLSHIMKLKPGDVLPIDKPEHIVAHVGGIPVLTSQYGTLHNQYALRVEHLINPILNSLNKDSLNE